MAKSDAPSDPLAVSFGKRLADVRASRGFNAVELGERAGMKKSYIWRVEQGLTLPSLRTAARLAQALNMTLSGLLRGVEIPND